MAKTELESIELQRLASDVPALQSLAELSKKIELIGTLLVGDVDAVCSRSIEVKTAADAEQLAAAIREARDVIDLVEEKYGPIKGFAHQVHKVICAKEKEHLTRIDTWINGIPRQGIKGASHSIAAWDLEERRKREEQQRAAQALLDKEHQKQIEKEARAAEKKGEPALAEQIREQGAQQGPVAFVPPVETPAGTSIATKYDFEIINPDQVPRQYCAPDEGKIRKFVNLMGKDAVNAIAGVRVFPLDPKATVRR